jgi:hypothetical protein
MRLYITDADVATLPVIRPGDQVVAILAPQGTSLEIPESPPEMMIPSDGNQHNGSEHHLQKSVIVRSIRDPVEIWKIHGEPEEHQGNQMDGLLEKEPASPMVLRPGGAGATPVMVGAGITTLPNSGIISGATPTAVYNTIFHQQGSPEAKMLYTGAPLGGISPGPFWPNSTTTSGGNGGRSGGSGRGIHSVHGGASGGGGMQLPTKPLAAPIPSLASAAAAAAAATGATVGGGLSHHQHPQVPTVGLLVNDPLDILEKKERDAVAAAKEAARIAAAGVGVASGDQNGATTTTTTTSTGLRPSSGASPGKKSPRLSPGALRPPASPNILLKMADGTAGAGTAIDADAWYREAAVGGTGDDAAGIGLT